MGNFSETGIAQVELSMTGVPYTTGSELDVVLMLDQSTSMDDDRISATVAATKAFIESIVINEDGTYNSNRIYVGYFNGTSTYDITDSNNIGGDLATVDNKTELDALFDDIDDEFDGSPSTSGTDYATSLAKCYSRLNTAKTDGTGNNRQQFCVFMSDGVPTHYQISATEYYGGSSSSSGGGFNVSEITAMFTGTNYDTRDTDYIYEYYSTQMKKNNVTIYTVGLGLNAKNNAWSSATATQCLNAASILLNDISGPAGETTQPDAKSTKTLSKKDSYFFSVEDSTAATDMKKVFQNIAMKILQAATDVTVEDKITDEYTMIFDIPEGTNEITGVTNDFYIEFLEYTLNATTHERVDSDNDGNTYEEAKSITKLYLKNTNGVYSAAKDSSGTAYDKPVFENKTIGDKGTLYYWTTDSNYSQKAAVSYTTDSTTYYFIPYGIKATDDGYDSTKWFNMTSGAYAYGTIENYGTEDSTNMSTNLVIATPYFVYNAGTKMIYWTVDKIGTTEYALRYFLYLDKSATEVGTDNETDPGSYPTNVHAYITYTNFKGNGCRQEFPKPQLTWSGAQVSYVFYLVNAAGQPINKSGQVVDFANATFVTDVYTEKTVWNKGEDGKITADSELDINWLAANLLPSDYKVYDEQALYQLHVYGNHDGTSYFDYFTIGGNDAATISSSLNNRLVNVNTTASTVSLTTTKVYNTKAGTKITGYGTYTSKATDSLTNETVLSNFDFYNTTVAFAVVWQPALAPDTVVVDYGLDVLINVTFNDLMQDNTISGIGLSREAYGTIAENTGISTNTVLGTADLTVADGSTISIEPNKVQIRFSQNDMTFEEPVKFYYESAVKYYESSQQKDGYLHSSVTVIPATTIYYEDEFVDLTTYTLIVDEAGKAVLDADGKKQYTATPSWTTVYNDGMTAGATATQAQDRPGTTLITGVVDANNNYGYDGAYAAMSQYSMGSAAKVNVYDGKYAKASFEFYGTGFDVISLTDTTTGYILVDIYEQDASNNWVLNNTYYSSVDTYYGYAYGDQDGDGTSEWYTVDSNSPNALYQVPVIKMTGMDYDHYKAEITVSYMSFMDHTDENGYDFYLDAIRIYDPTGNNNTTANNAYKADGEGWPTYFEVRNQIIEKNTFDSLNDENVSGIVFIDSDTSVNQAEIANYISYGPNNEVYLTANQAIAFDLNATAAAGSVAKVQLAVKTVGGTGKVEVYGVENSTKVDCLDETISTATDMYYDITALNNKTVVIKNTGSGDSSAIISITNVKVTYTEAQPAATEPAVAMFSIRRSTADAALATLNVEEDTTPEPSVPETSEPEASEPETSVPETTVPEITEPEETEPETAVPEETEPEYDREQVEEAIKEAVQTVVNTVVNALKNIFGRWFR